MDAEFVRFGVAMTATTLGVVGLGILIGWLLRPKQQQKAAKKKPRPFDSREEFMEAVSDPAVSTEALLARCKRGDDWRGFRVWNKFSQRYVIPIMWMTKNCRLYLTKIQIYYQRRLAHTMAHSILHELEHCRERLSFFSGRAEAGDIQKKWLEIYSTRVKTLEKQAMKLGVLTTDSRAVAQVPDTQANEFASDLSASPSRL